MPRQTVPATVLLRGRCGRSALRWGMATHTRRTLFCRWTRGAVADWHVVRVPATRSGVCVANVPDWPLADRRRGSLRDARLRGAGGAGSRLLEWSALPAAQPRTRRAVTP